MLDAGDAGWVLGLRRSSGRGNANLPQYSCLENFMGRVEPGGYSPCGCKEWTRQHTHTNGLKQHKFIILLTFGGQKPESVSLGDIASWGSGGKKQFSLSPSGSRDSSYSSGHDSLASKPAMIWAFRTPSLVLTLLTLPFVRTGGSSSIIQIIDILPSSLCHVAHHTHRFRMIRM